MLRLIASKAPMTFAQGITWESPGSLVGMLPVVISFAALAAWLSRPLIAASMAVAYPLQFAFAWIGWGLWNRPRPDIIAGGVAAPSLHSFPSGHALVVCVVYGFITYLWYRASRSAIERLLAIVVFITATGLICTARLVLGAHWLSDIIAGLAIAIPWLVTLIVALNRAEATAERHSKLN